MRKRTALGLILAVALLLIIPAFQSIAAVNPAYLTRFTTSLTYQNIDTQPAKILIQVHDSALQSPAVTVTPRPTLAPLASFAFSGDQK